MRVGFLGLIQVDDCLGSGEALGEVLDDSDIMVEKLSGGIDDVCGGVVGVWTD